MKVPVVGNMASDSLLVTIFSLLIIPEVLFGNPSDTSLGNTGSWNCDMNVVLVKQFQIYGLSDVMLLFKIIKNLLCAQRC